MGSKHSGSLHFYSSFQEWRSREEKEKEEDKKRKQSFKKKFLQLFFFDLSFKLKFYSRSCRISPLPKLNFFSPPLRWLRSILQKFWKSREKEERGDNFGRARFMASPRSDEFKVTRAQSWTDSKWSCLNWVSPFFSLPKVRLTANWPTLEGNHWENELLTRFLLVKGQGDR